MQLINVQNSMLPEVQSPGVSHSQGLKRGEGQTIQGGREACQWLLVLTAKQDLQV